MHADIINSSSGYQITHMQQVVTNSSQFEDELTWIGLLHGVTFLFQKLLCPEVPESATMLQFIPCLLAILGQAMNIYRTMYEIPIVFLGELNPRVSNCSSMKLYTCTLHDRLLRPMEKLEIVLYHTCCIYRQVGVQIPFYKCVPCFEIITLAESQCLAHVLNFGYYRLSMLMVNPVYSPVNCDSYHHFLQTSLCEQPQSWSLIR